VTAVVKVKEIVRSYFAMEPQGSVKHLSGNEDYFQGRVEKESVLTSHDISSLVVDRLCDQATRENTAVACFYFDFAARKEQSVTNMLGSLLKQVVGGMLKVLEEISRAFQEQRKAIGGWGPGLPDMIKMLQTITSELPTFVCIDALDECAAAQTS